MNYLFLGSRTHLLNDMFNDKSRAFYNAAMLMQIGSLPKEDTIEFLKDRFSLSGMTIDKAVSLYLIEQAGDIPYYIQLLAAEVWQYMISMHHEVTIEIIDICSEQIVDLKNDYYFELYDRQSAYQKKLLKSLLVSGENLFSADYAKRFRLSAASSTQKALSGLIESGIVEKSDRNYFIADPFFKRFLSRYAY